MTATIMNGRRIAEEIKAKIKEEIIALGNIRPILATILVGDNPSSKTYLRNKHAACLEVGIGSKNIELPTTTSQRELESLLRDLSEDPSVTGILLQLPLPNGLNDVSAIEAISPGKDVDGLHPHNLGLLLQGSGNLVPCTPKGVVVILRYYGIPIAGSHAVIINRSKLVGRPLSQLLLNNDATVTVCHSKTRELAHVCKEADVLIAGIGHRTEFAVGASLVKRGAAVVDVGTSVINGKVTGDVDFADTSRIAGYITPVPGGVGPMTIAMLLYNTLLAACKLHEKRLTFDPESLRNV
jgi:methylenetetrahydrofolate dehydrogenase (NADP+)/methenyltetrahydrofolate cyclohydrolase